MQLQNFLGTFLNDQLLQGPDYINNLAGVLMRFRQEEVVLIADIKQMFHRVHVPAEDCDALRFLWWSGNLSEEPEEYQMQVPNFALPSPLAAPIKPCDKLLMIMTTSKAEKLQKPSAVLKSIQTTNQATTLAVLPC